MTRQQPPPARPVGYYRNVARGLSRLVLLASVAGAGSIVVLVWIAGVGVARGPQVEFGSVIGLPIIAAYFIWGLLLSICTAHAAEIGTAPHTWTCILVQAFPLLVAATGTFAVHAARQCPAMVPEFFHPWLHTPWAYSTAVLGTAMAVVASLWLVRGLRGRGEPS